MPMKNPAHPFCQENAENTPAEIELAIERAKEILK